MVSPQLRIRGAVILLAVGALASIRTLPRAVQQCLAEPKPDATVTLEARFAALQPFVTDKPSLGYLTEGRHLDPQRVDLAKRLYMAQFALAPSIVERRTDRPWVIFDSDTPEAVPEIATREGWTLVTDLRDGIKLFRTARQE